MMLKKWPTRSSSLNFVWMSRCLYAFTWISSIVRLFQWVTYKVFHLFDIQVFPFLDDFTSIIHCHDQMLDLIITSNLSYLYQLEPTSLSRNGIYQRIFSGTQNLYKGTRTKTRGFECGARPKLSFKDVLQWNIAAAWPAGSADVSVGC